MVEKIRNQAIGVFDSGLGGLTVVKEMMSLLPNEDIVYFGDTARVPYGTKSESSIIKFSEQNTNVLLQYHVKAVVVACNSSSSYALPVLRRLFDVPIIGVILPGAKKACEASKAKRVGVIATNATIKSQKYIQAIQNIDQTIQVYSKACPLFVPLVEEGWFSTDVTGDIIKIYLEDLKQQNIDTLILGCTHYPLLKDMIQKVMGDSVTLIDSAKEVALSVQKLLGEKEMFKEDNHNGQYKYLVSDRPQEFSQIAQRFLGCELGDVQGVENV